MLTRKIFRFAPAVLAVALGALLMAGCRGHHCGWNASPEEKAEKLTKHIARELDLTADQKTRLDAIKNEILARRAEFKTLHEGFHEEILGQIRSSAVDTAKLNQSLEERLARSKEFRAFLVAKFAEFHAILDPAQREKLAKRIESHRKECR